MARYVSAGFAPAATAGLRVNPSGVHAAGKRYVRRCSKARDASRFLRSRSTAAAGAHKETRHGSAAHRRQLIQGAAAAVGAAVGRAAAAAPRPRRCASATPCRAPARGPAGAQVSQEPNYLLWAEQLNAAGGLSRQGREAPDRADRLRRPQRDRDLRAHLREADGQRQGRPDPAALGQQRQLRRRAAGQPLRLSDAGAHRAVAQADRHEAAVLLLAAAAARPDDGRAGRHAEGATA